MSASNFFDRDLITIASSMKLMASSVPRKEGVKIKALGRRLCRFYRESHACLNIDKYIRFLYQLREVAKYITELLDQHKHLLLQTNICVYKDAREIARRLFWDTGSMAIFLKMQNIFNRAVEKVSDVFKNCIAVLGGKTSLTVSKVECNLSVIGPPISLKNSSRIKIWKTS